MAAFAVSLYVGDEGTKQLLASDPFPDEPPKHVKAELYRYQFTTPNERRETGQWWHREHVTTYYGPASLGGGPNGTGGGRTKAGRFGRVL